MGLDMNTKARKPNSAKGAIDLVFPSAPKLLVIAVALACSSAYGATKTWNAGTGTWSNADTNWTSVAGSNSPQTGDTVIIDPNAVRQNSHLCRHRLYQQRADDQQPDVFEWIVC